MERAAITAALESLEAGDQREAVDILLAALEDAPYIERVRCPYCSLGFEWPGLRDAHLATCHWEEQLQQRAAA